MSVQDCSLKNFFNNNEYLETISMTKSKKIIHFDHSIIDHIAVENHAFEVPLENVTT